MGVPLPGTAAVLIPGLGCVNACSFCATSHHFQKKYIGYLNSGQELFRTMQEIEGKLGCREFFVMDENFLKQRTRAEELLEELMKHDKFYSLGVFSSAETINAIGVEFMAQTWNRFRLDWCGVESLSLRQDERRRFKGDDQTAAKLWYSSSGFGNPVSRSPYQRRNAGRHRFHIDLETDFVQFMELGPLPEPRSTPSTRSNAAFWATYLTKSGTDRTKSGSSIPISHALRLHTT